MTNNSFPQRRKTYLIQDPYDFDALEFINRMFLYFGLRPVCLYTDVKARHYGERQFPILSSDLIETSIDIAGMPIDELAEQLRQAYDVVAVIPYREDTVELAADLVEALDIPWNDPDVLRVFRNKFDLKKHITKHDPSIRVPISRIIRTVDDVWENDPPERFVIKPNDGLGNQRIGIFERTQLEEIAAHVTSDPPTTWILEEYIGGTEYHIDGQIRSDGEVTILAMVEYERMELNGYPTVYCTEIQCHRDHKHFDIATDYARRLLTATGLRRSPFHMELKVDDHGACVIDLGARFASDGGTALFSRLHPTRPDVFAVAAHDFVSDNTFATDPVDFTHYDQTTAIMIHGISEADHVIGELAGLDFVEQLPEFVGWVSKPALGDHVPITTDLLSSPYILELSATAVSPKKKPEHSSTSFDRPSNCSRARCPSSFARVRVPMRHALLRRAGGLGTLHSTGSPRDESSTQVR